MKRFSALVLIGLLSVSLLEARHARTSALSATATPPPSKSLSSYDGKVNDLLSKMTLEEKIGQMTQAEQDALKDVSDIETYFLGSVLSGRNSDPKEGNRIKAWTEMYDRYPSHALKTR